MRARLRLLLIVALLPIYWIATPISPASAAVGDTDSYFNLESATNSSYKYAVAIPDAGFHINNAITMEAWVYPTTTCSTNCIIVAKENEYIFGISNGVYIYAFMGASAWSWITTTVTAPINTWQHIAITRAASTNSMTMYRNGIPLYTGTPGTLGTSVFNNSNYNFSIGARCGLNTTINAVVAEQFIGDIDEVKIWSVARSQAEIKSDMHSYGPINNADLDIYYDFNDVSGTTMANDASGAASGTTLTLKNSPSFTNLETSTVSGSTKIVTFPRTYLSANGWKAPVGVTAINALVVGGGGGAGFNSGGGGSGGGVVQATISYNGSGLYPVVGMGGYGNVGGVFPYDSKANGDTSTLAGLSASGGNSGYNYKNPEYYPAPGGAAINGYGAGGLGSTSGVNANDGSAGYISTITGTSTYYGGGGGGGGWSGTRSGGAGGSGGGGAGATSGNGTSGTKNTGGGGGSNATGSTIAGDGGSGVIILAFSAFSGEISGASTGTYRATQLITATVSSAGKVTFYAQGKTIPGCVKISTVSSSTITASCNWRPSQRGNIQISARLFPASSPGISSPINTVISQVSSRSGKR